MKLEVNCTRCGAHKLTLEAPPGIGPVAQTEWIDRRREEARLGDKVYCGCGAEIDYEIAPVSKDVPAGIKPRDRTRPILDQVEVEVDTIRVRGRFLQGATLQVTDGKGVTLLGPLDGDDVTYPLHPSMRVRAPRGRPDDDAPKQLRLDVANDHGQRPDGSTLHVPHDGTLRAVTRS